MVGAEGPPAFLKEPQSESHRFRACSLVNSAENRRERIARMQKMQSRNGLRVCDIWGAFPYRIFFRFISDFEKSSVSACRMLGGVKCSGNWKIMNTISNND